MQRRVLALLLVVPLAVSCRDASAPLPEAGDAREPFVAFGNGLDNGEYSVALPQGAHDITLAGFTLNSYPLPTLVEIKYEGTISAYYFDGRGLGPKYADISVLGVHPEYCFGYVTVRYSNGGVSRPRTAFGCPMPDSTLGGTTWTDVLLVSGTGTATRYKGSNAITGCYGSYCRLYEGGPHRLTINRVPAELSLTPSQALVMPGQSVTFTSAATPSSYKNRTVPITSRQWRWQPDGGTFTTLANCNGLPTCAPPAGTAGTLEHTATVNGLVKVKTARVEVKTDQLIASANKSTVKPGEEVTFTASTQNGTNFSVQSWVWTGTGGGSIAMTPNGSSCGQEKTCKIRVHEPGYMTVTAVVLGTTIPQSVSVQISVIPCPPITDDPNLTDFTRKQLLDALERAQTGGYHEVGGYFSRRASDGETYVVDVPSTLAPSPCMYDADNSKIPGLPPGFVIDYDLEWHVHPYPPFTTYTGCAQQPGKQVKSGLGPSLPTIVNGQPAGDWTIAALGKSGYLIDGNGSIFRWAYPPGGYSGDDTRRWDRDGDSICYTEVTPWYIP